MAVATILMPCGEMTINPTAFGGHCFYVRRCVRGEQYGENFFDRIENGIVLPQQAYIEEKDSNGNVIFTTIRNIWDRTNLAEVMAKGDMVGKPCSQKHARVFNRVRCINDCVDIGDILVLPDEHIKGIILSPYAEYDRFVEESVPLAIIKR